MPAADWSLGKYQPDLEIRLFVLSGANLPALSVKPAAGDPRMIFAIHQNPLVERAVRGTRIMDPGEPARSPCGR